MTSPGDSTPGLGRRRLMTKSGSGSIPQTKGENLVSDKSNIARFGAVKVHAGLLSQTVDIKTYVVTNKTTAKELVSIVLTGYKSLWDEHRPIPFCLSLERINRRGGSSTIKAIKLHETAKPLEMQARYPRGDSKFTLQMKPECGVLTVSDKSLPEKSVSRSVFVSEKTTCSDLIAILLKDNSVDPATREQYGVYEVEINTKLWQELKPSHNPLIIQRQRLDAFEYYFEVRRKDSQPTTDLIRRNHSLEDLSGGHRRVLNYKELKKSLIPRRRQWLKSTDDLSNAGSQDSTLTKLKDNVGQLRKHIDTIQSRRLSLPGNIMSDVSDDISPMAGQTRRLGKSISHESFQQEEQKGAGSTSRHSMRQDDVNGYDTGSSLNESDGGSGIVHKAHDSAYSSGRISHSSQHRNRRKKSSLLESGDSSPEGPHCMTKSQSMMDLKSSSSTSDHRPIARPKPTRIHSDSCEQTAIWLSHTQKTFSGSDDNINSWARRKQYDSVRRSNSGVVGSRANHGRLSLDGHSLALGAPEDIPSVSPTSSAGRSRTRRTLPQVPVTKGNNALDEHMRRISAVALVKARLDKQKRETVEGWLGSCSRENSMVAEVPETAPDHEEGINQTRTPAGDRPTGEERNTSNNNTSRQPPAYGLYSSGRPNTDFRPIPNDKDIAHCDSGTSSQDALKRIISDLRDAAYKPIDSSIHSDNRATSRSSGSSGFRERDPHPHNITYEKRRSSLECALDAQTLDIPRNYAFNEFQESPLLRKGLVAPSYINGKLASMSHPSINTIMKSYEMHQIEIFMDQRTNYSRDFGIELFNAEFSDAASHDIGTSSAFRTPAGRRVLIGRGKGAFQAVSSGVALKTGHQQMSLVAIRALHEGSAAMESGLLQEGDFIVEVNGTFVTHETADKVNYLMTNQDGALYLVVARPRLAKQPTEKKVMSTVETECIIKDLEKLKLKYQSVKQDTEKHMDIIAELRLEIQDRERKKEEYVETVTRKDDQIYRLQIESQRREEKISEWKLEANNRNIEIARLKFDAQQREVKIEQLRKLLIQQSEVMQIQDNGYGDYDQLYEGEHVSAV